MSRVNQKHWVYCFLILKHVNEVWKTWKLARSRDMTSIGCGKKWRRFHKSWCVHCLETEQFGRKNRGSDSKCIRFEGEFTCASLTDLDTFHTLNIHHIIVHVKSRHFSGFICYILVIKSISRLLMDIIQILTMSTCNCTKMVLKSYLGYWL